MAQSRPRPDFRPGGGLTVGKALGGRPKLKAAILGGEASKQQMKRAVKTAYRKGRKKGAAGREEPLPGALPYAEADTTMTSLLRAQGKAFALGREGSSGTRMGATRGVPFEEEEEPKTGKRKPRKRRGVLKTKGRGPKFGVDSRGRIRPTGRPKNPK